MFNKSSLSKASTIAASLLLLASQICQAHPIHSNNTLEKIAKTKSISLGYQDDAFPFSYLDAQRPAGYSIDICNKIVDAVKTKLKIKDLKVHWIKSSTASQFVLIKNHVTDVMCIPAFYSELRHQQAEFSLPYFFSRTRFVTRKNNHTDTIEDLAGHSILVKSGTIYVEQIHNINRVNDLNLNIELDNNNNVAFNDIESGELPALVSSTVFLKGMIALSAKAEELEISDEALSPPIPAGLLLPLNDSEFKNFLDSTMQSLFSSKDFTAIYQRWFQSPIPPKAINLNIPMSTDLKALITSTSPYVY
ncbi:amino acid ABC transporter substrate-binding protein [Buttiauxella sp. B2]|uniref:amino acid ABC transporter substrate-binding protein n=1 Tax=Buttiauxella sp. B2 TaxID=2587812 RepID=UPI00111E7DE3|nr:amino acid ABC transporter substrate-binding protein [Buttiauxella sp. B2]TNV20868.1 amino acid ABC transporter substrate-binding protein [Buttiauxella sp. B2]